MGTYRDEFFAEVLRRHPSAKFYVGAAHFDPTLTLSPFISARCTKVSNVFLLNRRLLWQRGVTRPGLSSACTILELNPRILHVWLLLVARRMLGRRTILWGHAWPRNGAESWTMWLRRAMIWLATGVVLYTHEDQQAIARLTRRRTFVAPNAVCSRNGTTLGAGNATDVVLIGRLVPQKRPMLMLEAWNRVCDLLPESQLVFVGSGPLESDLRNRAADLGVSDRVRFTGQVSDPGALAEIFANAFTTVSAGYAGLSITHGFAHGVPALIADDEPHAPEISLADCRNSRWFKAGSAEDLGRVLLEMFHERNYWLDQRPAISEATLANYSVEAMADGFLSSAHLA